MSTKYPPFEERFWSRVEKSDSGCWLWTGCTRQGYGAICRNGKQVDAHRASWEMTHGPIPDGLWVLHRCDNRRCIRPDHLFLGTVADNNHDMYAKGRGGKTGARGTKNGHAKLTAEKVLDIRRLWSTGVYTQASLAWEFGVNQQNISNIVTRKSWTYL